MAKKGKKGTPAELDFLFRRQLISENDYRHFWRDWHRSNRSEKQEIINEYKQQFDEIAKLEKKYIKHKGKIYTGKEARSKAEKEAKKTSGYIVRRDRFGRFNSHGKSFLVINRKK